MKVWLLVKAAWFSYLTYFNIVTMDLFLFNLISHNVFFFIQSAFKEFSQKRVLKFKGMKKSSLKATVLKFWITIDLTVLYLKTFNCQVWV